MLTNVKNIPKLNFLKAPNDIIILFEKVVSPIRNKMEINFGQGKLLNEFREILLSKLATIEN